MASDSLVLTLDFGTQSVRAALTNKQGETVALSKIKYRPPYVSPVSGYAEQDADFYWINAKQCLIQLCKENPDKLEHIVGATVTTFRDTSVQLDENLKPLRKCILWLDQRMAKGKEKIPLHHRAIFKIIGMWPTIVLNRARTPAHWLKENEPETWNRTYKYVNISTYLVYKITGRLADSVACMVGHYPINYRKGKWYQFKALKGRFFGIPNRMLCELVPVGEVIATIKDEIADEIGLPRGIKLYATGSDKACETVGLGALNPTVAAVSYGTASTVEVSNQKYHEPEPFLPAYQAAVPGWHNMEVQIYRGYWMLTWYAKEFAKDFDNERDRGMIEELLDAELRKVPPGSEGLIVQPYWGPGLSRPFAKGAIIGFSDVHTRIHIYRAIIEGIAYSLREGLESIEHSQHQKVDHIMISGGGSQSDDICQITADVFGLPVSRVQTFETSTLGAALSVFLACKEFANIEEATHAMVHKTKTFYPNELAHKNYDTLYKKVYVKMYPQLKDVYRDLNKFLKRGN